MWLLKTRDKENGKHVPWLLCSSFLWKAESKKLETKRFGCYVMDKYLRRKFLGRTDRNLAGWKDGFGLFLFGHAWRGGGLSRCLANGLPFNGGLQPCETARSLRESEVVSVATALWKRSDAFEDLEAFGPFGVLTNDLV